MLKLQGQRDLTKKEIETWRKRFEDGEKQHDELQEEKDKVNKAYLQEIKDNYMRELKEKSNFA